MFSKLKNTLQFVYHFNFDNMKRSLHMYNIIVYCFWAVDGLTALAAIASAATAYLEPFTSL